MVHEVMVPETDSVQEKVKVELSGDGDLRYVMAS